MADSYRARHQAQGIRRAQAYSFRKSRSPPRNDELFVTGIAYRSVFRPRTSTVTPRMMMPIAANSVAVTDSPPKEVPRSVPTTGATNVQLEASAVLVVERRVM